MSSISYSGFRLDTVSKDLYPPDAPVNLFVVLKDSNAYHLDLVTIHVACVPTTLL